MISVIMPVYNTEKYLSEAIASILNQTYDNFEFIIIDDASTDRSLSIIRKFINIDSRIRLIRNETNLGISRSRNLGIAVAKGDYIAVMDSDDVSLPERFKKQILFLDCNPKVGVLGTNYLIIDELGNVTNHPKITQESSRVWWGLFFFNQIVHPSVMMRRSIFSDFNIRYEESLSSALDYDLWFQVIPHFEIRNLDERLHLYRLHSQNISVVKQEEQENNAATILKFRTEGFLNMELPKVYGTYIRNSATVISRRDAILINRAIYKLHRIFEKRYPYASLEDKRYVDIDYHKRMKRIVDSQHNKLTYFPYYYFDLIFRIKKNLINRFAGVCEHVSFRQN